jgi:hypothetical protein
MFWYARNSLYAAFTRSMQPKLKIHRDNASLERSTSFDFALPKSQTTLFSERACAKTAIKSSRPFPEVEGGSSGFARLDKIRRSLPNMTSGRPVNVFLSSFSVAAVFKFFPELNEPARPTAARPVSHDASRRRQAAGGSAVRTERRGQDRRKPAIRGP